MLAVPTAQQQGGGGSGTDASVDNGASDAPYRGTRERRISRIFALPNSSENTNESDEPLTRRLSGDKWSKLTPQGEPIVAGLSASRGVNADAVHADGGAPSDHGSQAAGSLRHTLDADGLLPSQVAAAAAGPRKKAGLQIFSHKNVWVRPSAVANTVGPTRARHHLPPVEEHLGQVDESIGLDMGAAILAFEFIDRINDEMVQHYLPEIDKSISVRLGLSHDDARLATPEPCESPVSQLLSPTAAATDEYDAESAVDDIVLRRESLHEMETRTPSAASNDMSMMSFGAATPSVDFSAATIGGPSRGQSAMEVDIGVAGRSFPQPYNSGVAENLQLETPLNAHRPRPEELALETQAVLEAQATDVGPEMEERDLSRQSIFNSTNDFARYLAEVAIRGGRPSELRPDSADPASIGASTFAVYDHGASRVLRPGRRRSPPRRSRRSDHPPPFGSTSPRRTPRRSPKSKGTVVPSFASAASPKSLVCGPSCLEPNPNNQVTTAPATVGASHAATGSTATAPGKLSIFRFGGELVASATKASPAALQAYAPADSAADQSPSALGGGGPPSKFRGGGALSRRRALSNRTCPFSHEQMEDANSVDLRCGHRFTLSQLNEARRGLELCVAAGFAQKDALICPLCGDQAVLWKRSSEDQQTLMAYSTSADAYLGDLRTDYSESLTVPESTGTVSYR